MTDYTPGKYTAVYYRHHVKQIYVSDTYEDASDFLYTGGIAGEIAEAFIVGPQEEILPCQLRCNKLTVMSGKIYSCISPSNHVDFYSMEEHDFEEVSYERR